MNTIPEFQPFTPVSTLLRQPGSSLSHIQIDSVNSSFPGQQNNSVSFIKKRKQQKKIHLKL